ncbi:MAG: hypothetical protein LLG14_19570 [Nocardiaceae bacterium]|nr:hypothetical protein [Nocardiaceae bacterium]
MGDALQVEYVDLDIAAKCSKIAPLRQCQVLVSYKRDPDWIMAPSGIHVGLQLGGDLRNGLLAARKVDGHDPWLTVLRAVRITSTIGSTKWVGGVDVSETFGVKDLRS